MHSFCLWATLSSLLILSSANPVYQEEVDVSTFQHWSHLYFDFSFQDLDDELDTFNLADYLQRLEAARNSLYDGYYQQPSLVSDMLRDRRR